MPKELVAVAPGKAELRDYELPPLGERDVRIKSDFAAPKHGTESHAFLGDSPFRDRQFDPEYRMFLPVEGGTKANPYPASLGNMTVGTVTEAGPKVTRFKIGDKVYGHLPIKEIHTSHEEGRQIPKQFSLGSGVRERGLHHVPPGTTPQQIVLLDPAHFALAAVRDANIRLGETVAVFGLGAIGLLAVQMARLSGAQKVFAVDLLENRRNLAISFGADDAFDPSQCDVGYEIKKATDKKGVDVSIEVSASYKALQDAIRSVHYAGLVVTVSFYHGSGKDLRLGEEWHLTRPTMVSSMPVWGNPSRDYPMWDDERIEETALQLVIDGKLNPEGLVDPIVSFEESPEAYMNISRHPEKCVKVGIDFHK